MSPADLPRGHEAVAVEQCRHAGKGRLTHAPEQAASCNLRLLEATKVAARGANTARERAIAVQAEYCKNRLIRSPHALCRLNALRMHGED